MMDEKEPMERVELEFTEDAATAALEDTARPPIVEPLFSKIDTFEEANLDARLSDVIASMEWPTPTPVQGLCLPYTLQGRDVAGFAQTGTGKTGVFLITIAQRLLALGGRENRSGDMGLPFAVILAPTRELAMQISDDAEVMLAKLGISSMAVFGGIDYEKQAKALRSGIDVIVATPGRLKDYYQKKIVSLKDVQVFVCDEADRMFDMGFIEDVEFFLEKLGERTQKLLFSATTNEKVKELAFEYLETPEYISVNPEIITPELIEQHAIICESKNKLKVMLGLLREQNPNRAIIFTNTKLVADWLHYKLVRNGISADMITGDLPQNKRIQLIQKIKAGELKCLIATDVASRGLHISDVTHVYNFDLPDEAANYVHRIGRTARAGARGHSYSLVCEDYGGNLAAVKDMLAPAVDLRSEWFSPAYLEIEDKAGNPYADPEFRNNTLDKERGRGHSDRPDRDRPRSDRPPDRDRPRGDRPPDRDRPRSDRPPGRSEERKGAEGRSRNQGGRSRGGGGGRSDHDQQQPMESRRSHGGAEGQGRSQQSERGRSAKRELMRNDSKGGHSRGGERQPSNGRGDRGRNANQRPDRAAASAASGMAPVKTPSSITGLIKRFFSVMFGGKKD